MMARQFLIQSRENETLKQDITEIYEAMRLNLHIILDIYCSNKV